MVPRTFIRPADPVLPHLREADHELALGVAALIVTGLILLAGGVLGWAIVTAVRS